MQIAEKKVVTVTYNLHANLPEEQKQHIETADKSHPLSFIYGIGMMIPGFEKSLAGKSSGDSFDFSIDPDQAYGESDETAVVNLPIDIFKNNDVIDFEILKVGNILPMSDNQGNVMNGKVKSYDQQTVTMDFNHPLAGHMLHFTGEILDVREATQEELDHGHVH